MPEETSGTRHDDLAEIIAEYSDLCAEGDADLTEFLTKHPDLPSELVSELHTCKELHDLIEGTEPWSTLQLEDFQIARVLGAGTFGIVYEARQISLDRRVALKILQPRFLEDRRAVERFQREARVIARLHHKNIVRVHSTGFSKGTPFINMELVAGENLKRIIAAIADVAESSGGGSREGLPGTETSQDGRVTRELLKDLHSRGRDTYCRRMADLFAGAAEGLQHAHGQGVIHRDLKPSNLILDLDGDLRVLDFGLARVEGVGTGSLSSGCVVGTPLYMSPEQFVKPSHELGPATDIYSLGVTLYEALTLRPPFSGRTQKEIEENIRYEDPPPLTKVSPGTPDAIDAIVRKCLYKNSGARFATAEALAQELRRFARGLPIETQPPSLYRSWLRRAWRLGKRLRLAAAVSLILIVGFVLGKVWRESLQAARTDYVNELRTASEELGWEELRRARPFLDSGAWSASRPKRREWDPVTPDESRGGADSMLESLQAAAQTLLQASALPASLETLPGAIDRLEKAVNTLPEEPRAYFYLARAHLLEGREDLARDRLATVIGKRGDYVPALVLKFFLERDALAVRESPLLPDWARKWLEGMHLEAARKWKDAAKAYRQAQELVESDTEYRWLGDDLRLRTGMALLHDGLLIPAVYDLSEIASRGDRLEFPLMVGRALLSDHKVREAASILSTEFGRLSGPRAVDLARLVSGLYREAGLHEEAKTWAERALGIDRRNVPALLAAGHAWLELKNIGKARECFDGAAREAPEDPSSRIAMSALREREKNRAGALKELEEAIKLDPNCGEAHYHTGRLHQQAGRLNDALVSYGRAKDCGGIHAALAANNSGICLDLKGSLEDAIEEYRWAADAAPLLAGARFNLGWAYLRQLLYTDAAREYEEALQLGIDTADLHQNLAICFQYMGEADKALVSYQRALDKGGDERVLHKSLGCLHDWKQFWVRDQPAEREKHLLAAKDHYARAVDLDPEWSEARHMLGLELGRLGRDADAEAEHRQAIEDTPAYLPPYLDLARILLKGSRELELEDLAGEIRMFEAAETELGPASPVGEILSRYRSACLPRVTSYAAIDWQMGRYEAVPAEDTRWSVAPAGAGLEWTLEDFEEDTAWDSSPDAAPASFEVDAARGDRFRLRSRFEGSVITGEGSWILRVRLPEGASFTAYLNGEPVAFEETPETGGRESEPVARWYRIPRELVLPGKNVLALQAHAALDPLDIIQILAPPPHSEMERRARAGLESFLAVAVPVSDAGKIAYWEGRIRALAGNHAEAADFFSSAVNSDPSSPEPRLALAESLRQEGDHAGAASLLAEAIAQGLRDDRLVDAWLQTVMVGLERRPAEISQSFPSPPAGIEGRGADLRWLLAQLRTGTVRINSGGRAYRSREGEEWGVDRFFHGPGRDLYLLPIGDRTGEIQDPAVRMTSRVFYAHEHYVKGYSVPLPPGSYLVTITFVEAWEDEDKPRREFDIVLEGKVRRERYQPIANGFGNFEDLSHDVEVQDGVLNIDFRRRENDPEVCGVTIQAQ